MYYVYILRNKVNNHLYKGVCADLQKRIREHNSGNHKYTAQYMPWEIAYYETYSTFEEARKRELFFKSGCGREFLKDLIEHMSTDQKPACRQAGLQV